MLLLLLLLLLLYVVHLVHLVHLLLLLCGHIRTVVLLMKTIHMKRHCCGREITVTPCTGW